MIESRSEIDEIIRGNIERGYFYHWIGTQIDKN